MPKSNLAGPGGQTFGSLSIEEKDIRGSGAPFFPQLEFQLVVEPKPSVDGLAEVLLFPMANIGLHTREGRDYSVGTALPKQNAAIETPTGIQMLLRLTPQDIESIEELRKGDNVNFVINLRCIGLTRRVSEGAVLSFHNCEGTLNVTKAKSEWVENILPSLGYSDMRIIELPVSNGEEGKQLTKAWQEIREAEKYYWQGDYRNVMEHSRSALEAAVASKRVKIPDKERPSFGDRVEAFAKQHLETRIGGSKAARVAEITSSLWSLCSPPHHPVPPGYDRPDALMTLHVISSLVTYIAHALKRR